MGMVTDPELFLDLSQHIDRQSLRLRVVPCITPGGRVWKRRDASWLLAPEAIMAQGFDPHRVPHLKTFTHRQAKLVSPNMRSIMGFLGGKGIATRIPGLKVVFSCRFPWFL